MEHFADPGLILFPDYLWLLNINMCKLSHSHMHPAQPRPPTENAVFSLDDSYPSAVACYSRLKSWDLACDCFNNSGLNSAHKEEHRVPTAPFSMSTKQFQRSMEQ